MPDVTEQIRADQEMFIASDVYRQGFNPGLLAEPELTALLAAHSWSDEMKAAIGHLADLRAGRIKCTRSD